MQKFRQTFGGERVLVTGHTGFKGAWLSFWLSGIGAQVSGYSLDPEPSQRELFEIVREGGAFAPGRDVRGNIGDYDRVRECVRETRPDFVFHLAAQSLVRRSYVRPVETFASNVLGTVHLLEAVRAESPDATVVVVTTDKCYENREWAYSYRETDPLGGRDPYSASKAAAEIATAAWRASFFDGAGVSGRIATARAGNVIGGGDYADDRIVPDLVRALAAGQALGVRSPGSTRPWQHVLDCLSGYLALARWLATDPSASGHCERAFNFGPTQESERTVGDLVEECLRHWPGRWEDLSEPGAPHEATRLAVSIERSRAVLGWRPNWDFPTAVAETIEWYRARTEGASPSELRGIMNRQIAAFEA